MADTEDGNYQLVEQEPPVAVSGRWFKAAAVLLLGAAGLVLAVSTAGPSNSAHLLSSASVELDSRGPPMVHFEALVNTHLPVIPGHVNGAFVKVPGTDMSVGLYRLNAGNSVSYTYRYPEFKYIVEGEWQITDGTGQVVHAKAGDLMYFPLGTSVDFKVVKTGLGYYIADASTCFGNFAEALKTATALNPRMVHFPQIAEKASKDIAFSKLPGLEMTVGLWRQDAGSASSTTHDNEEFALVTEGEFHIEDGTGQRITAKAGDLVYLPKGTQLSSKASNNHFGMALISGVRGNNGCG